MRWFQRFTRQWQRIPLAIVGAFFVISSFFSSAGRAAAAQGGPFTPQSPEGSAASLLGRGALDVRTHGHEFFSDVFREPVQAPSPNGPSRTFDKRPTLKLSLSAKDGATLTSESSSSVTFPDGRTLALPTSSVTFSSKPNEVMTVDRCVSADRGTPPDAVVFFSFRSNAGACKQTVPNPEAGWLVSPGEVIQAWAEAYHLMRDLDQQERAGVIAFADHGSKIPSTATAPQQQQDATRAAAAAPPAVVVQATAPADGPDAEEAETASTLATEPAPALQAAVLELPP